METIPLSKHLRFSAMAPEEQEAGWERKCWHPEGGVPVEEPASVAKGIAGGNIFPRGVSQRPALAAARRASEAVCAMPGVITPFPGGVVRSGSKVGSRYKGLVASTNDAFCPTRRGRVESSL
jgi:formylmethanofuran--tetrahydromethanopterin N-formyltransferase